MDAEGAARLRVVVGRLERRLNAAVSELDLTPTQMWVLTSVVRHGPIGISELATQEGLNPTMLSRVIGKLDDAGLIKRVPDPTDRRAALVEPTAAGRRMKTRIQQRRTAALAVSLALLSPEQDAALVAALPVLEVLATEMKRP